MSYKESNYRVGRNGCLQFRLGNGVLVSVGIGQNHYCASGLSCIDKDWVEGEGPDDRRFLWDSPDAEVAFIGPRGEFVTSLVRRLAGEDFDEECEDSVISHVGPEQFTRLLLAAATLPRSRFA